MVLNSICDVEINIEYSLFLYFFSICIDLQCFQFFVSPGKKLVAPGILFGHIADHHVVFSEDNIDETRLCIQGLCVGQRRRAPNFQLFQ